MIKLSIIVVSALFLMFVGAQAYHLSGQRRALQEEAKKIEGEGNVLAAENETLEADLKYYANSENLMKEFRSLFNYRKADEELHIIVPVE